MGDFFSNIRDNWPTIVTILTGVGGAVTFAWKFITGGLKAVKEAKTAAALSADKAGTSATNAQTSARQLAGASQTLESLQFQVEQLMARLETAERAVKQRDKDFATIKELLDETQQTLEITAIELAKVQQREIESTREVSRLTAVVKEQDKKLADYERRLNEALGANATLARENAQLKQVRPTKRKIPHEGAIESEGQQ
jgi:chromosome segregation ATPase